MGNEHSASTELTVNGKISEKHENGSVNGTSANIKINGLATHGKSETVVHQNGESHTLNLTTESSEFEIVESVSQPASAPVVSEIPDAAAAQKEEAKKGKEEKVNLFGKVFKKKAESAAHVESEKEKEKEKENKSEDQPDVSLPPNDPHQETANLKQESESLTEAERATPDSSPEEDKVPDADNGYSEPVESREESNPEENPVMNFFKTLVPTKTTKKETATPDVAKDQSQKETQPAATTTVAQISEPPAAPKGMSIPPPPPPEPPKMEVKAELAAKPAKPSPKEEPKAAAKEPESSKGKSAKDTLSKFFRSKTTKEAPEPVVDVKETPEEAPAPVVEVQTENKVEAQEVAPVAEVTQPVVEEQVVKEVPQPVVEAEKVDPSKAGTLEAAAKPEPPPPVQEEKKTASKSPFLSLFKTKAAEAKKATPTPPPAAGEAAQAVKAKEEPKAAAKSSEAAVDNKPAPVASQAGDDAASVPRKLEKRNSIQLFFKNLGQKRHSTDAGVQTEPVVVAPGAEKAK